MNKKLLDYFNNDSLAASVWLGKYAAEGEETPDDTHKRMAKEFWRVEKEYQEGETDELKSELSEYFNYNHDNLSTLMTLARFLI